MSTKALETLLRKLPDLFHLMLVGLVEFCARLPQSPRRVLGDVSAVHNTDLSTSPLVGDVCLGHDVVRRDSHQQLTGHGVAAT
ncbi:MAG TPA: hypothetical protein VHH53_11825, partial [Pseudonocardiaceae bacterium]|nr:hypothetical protein [Pseudonocardiaceae bacterium]